MYKGYKVVDADSHAMEPDDLWERYLDKRFAAHAPATRRVTIDHPYFMSTEVMGHKWSATYPTTHTPYVDMGTGRRVTYMEAYDHQIRRGFSPESYLDYMDKAGLDYAVLYPTLCLHTTTVPDMDAQVAAPIKRAYNDWLHDFCNGGKGRIIGSASLDLRDVKLAIKEARRCVKELGFRSVYILPETPVEGQPLDHPMYDELWAEVASLGVPLGTHEAMFHKNGNVGWVGAKQVANISLKYASTAVTFALGEMVGGLMFAGSICARHPNLRVLFTESSVGWVATWVPFLDEKWERAKLMGSQVPEHEPSYYFKRQCAISGEPGEVGYAYCFQGGYGDCLMTATDFPHPEVTALPDVLAPFFDGRHAQLSPEQLKKVLWENPARMFGLK